MGMDNHGYLLGIHAFVKAGDQHLLPRTLSAAAFWVGLRQEIYSAVMNHQPVRINLEHSIVDRSFDVADDTLWANRAVVHCADVLNFCFDEDKADSKRWEELSARGRQWRSRMPASFTPLYLTECSGQMVFPEIWFHRSCHGTFWQPADRVTCTETNYSDRSPTPTPCRTFPHLLRP